MSKATPALDGKAVDLLLNILETPKATISGAVLHDYFGRQSGQLISANLLEHCGNELATTSMADHDDAPVSVTWSAEHSGYGYFSASAGWVTVPDERLAVLAVRFPILLAQMTVELDFASGSRATVLIPGLLWEIGDARLGGRSYRIPIWFARRLYERSVWQQLKDATLSRPAPRMRFLLTSTPRNRWLEARLPGHEIVDVRGVFDHGLGIIIDPAILAARIDGEHERQQGAIWHSADFGLIKVNGKDYRFTGSKQRQIVRQLVEAYQAGSPICLTASVLTEADCGNSVNTLAKAFSGRQDWRDFIREEAGNCWIFT
jgi:hypothetical protein